MNGNTYIHQYLRDRDKLPHRLSISRKAPIEDRIEKYLDGIASIFKQDGSCHSGHGERVIEKYIYNNTFRQTEENVGKQIQRIISLDQKRAFDEGRGDDYKPLSFRQGNYIVGEKIREQNESLNTIIEYIKHNEDNHPNWFRYLMAISFPKMGSIDTESYTYSKRSSSSVDPYPRLNHAVVVSVKKSLEEQFKIETLPKNQQKQAYISFFKQQKYHFSLYESLEKTMQSKSFEQLHAFFCVQLSQQHEYPTKEGQWKKYDQGSDHTILENDIRDKGTEWCTATGLAQNHLDQGDFYVYYTYTPYEYKSLQDGHKVTPTLPVIAIRMLENHVYEVRGSLADQQVHDNFMDIAKDKYMTLIGGHTFEKKYRDVSRLNNIYNRSNSKDGTRLEAIDLSKNELEFLYEVNSSIETFGHAKHPKLLELLNSRRQVGREIEDYCKIFNCSPNEVISDREASNFDNRKFLSQISAHTRVFIGYMNYFPKVFDLSHLKNLHVAGNVNIYDTNELKKIQDGFTCTRGVNIVGCSNLESIGKGFRCLGMLSAQYCKKLRSIGAGFYAGGEVNLSGCTSLINIGEGFTCASNLNLSGCTSLINIGEGFTCAGNLNFSKCTSLTCIPDGFTAGGFINFSKCTSLTSIPDGFSCARDVDFSGCTSLNSIPPSFHCKGDADFTGCTNLDSRSKKLIKKRGYKI